jgi:hypothetical protein
MSAVATLESMAWTRIVVVVIVTVIVRVAGILTLLIWTVIISEVVVSILRLMLVIVGILKV